MEAPYPLIFCIVSVCCAMLGQWTAGAEDNIHSRDKRQVCSKTTEELTMENFIRLVKKIESHSSMKSDPLLDVANMLRSRFASGKAFWYFLGESSIAWNDALLSPEEKAVLLRMIVHGDDESTLEERGIVRTSAGDTVAVGHVITGIMAALDRDTDHSLAQLVKGTDYKLDNLYVVTISGDLGQTTKTKYNGEKAALIGPGGSWNDACPKQYILSGPASEATNAEVKGDIDGFVLGSGVKSWKNKKLSQIFEQYYGSGISGDSRLRHIGRIENFNHLVVDLELIHQSTAFLQAYDADAAKKYKSKIPSTVYNFYGQEYMKANNCPSTVKRKYTVANFIEMVKKIETGNMKTTVNAILGLSSYYKKSYFGTYLEGLGSEKPIDGFDLYAMYGMIDHKVDATFKRQVGVITDNNGDTIAIGHVLAGISAGLDRKTDRRRAGTFLMYYYVEADNVFGATIAGELFEAGKTKKQGTPRFGPKGSWDTSCPARYNIAKGSPITAASHPEILGDMDGLILGHVVAGKSVKLSDLLTQYYGNGLSSDSSISSANRSKQFRKYAPLSKITEQVGLVCNDELAFIRAASGPYGAIYNGYDCEYIKKSWTDAFDKEFLSTPSGSLNLYNGGRLPSIKILRQTYLGQTTSDNDLYVLAGIQKTSTTGPDVLRISYMLNQLEGHFIQPTTQGGVQGKKNKVYLVDQSKMIGYLTSRYGSPTKVSDEASIIGKPGIIRRGDMALWDGKTGIPGVGEISLWQAKGSDASGDCDYQAEQGDCEFYLQCVEKTLGCTDIDYPRAYGHKYCSKFGEHYNKFNSEGKTWVDEVRVCLMKALLPHRRNPSMTCNKIKEIAFNSHVNCYIESGVGFCKVMAAPSNWDALWAVYELADFFSEDWRHAWGQVVSTLIRCAKNGKSHTEAEAETKLIKFKALINDKVSPAEAVDAEAVSEANAGDCTFYERFERRFPCAGVNGVSHMTDVELPLCLRGYSVDGLMNTAGRTWYEEYQKCLMGALKPLYQGNDVSCTPLRLTAYQKRLDCMVSSGLCDILLSNEFALDQWADAGSFPYVIPKSTFKMPLEKSDVIFSPIYYWNALYLKEQFADALAVCALRSSMTKTTYDKYVKNRGVKSLR